MIGTKVCNQPHQVFQAHGRLQLHMPVGGRNTCVIGLNDMQMGKRVRDRGRADQERLDGDEREKREREREREREKEREREREKERERERERERDANTPSLQHDSFASTVRE